MVFDELLLHRSSIGEATIRDTHKVIDKIVNLIPNGIIII